MSRLWVRLALAFVFVALVSLAVIAVVANSQIGDAFRRYVAQNQIVDSGLAARLAQYYADQGGWDGVESVFTSQITVTGNGRGQGQGRGWRGGASYLLADAGGRVVYDSLPASAQRAATLSEAEKDAAVLVSWNGSVVGYVLSATPGQSDIPETEQFFLDQINHALAQAGLIAALVGLALGVVVARGLTAPLGRLAAAARSISPGRLEQRVPERGSREVRDLARAFNEMADNLHRAETARRNMVADIAHELRTPLSVVQGNLQAILDGVYPLEKSEIATIHDETGLLAQLIEDLRELALAEAGQLRLNPQPTDLPVLLGQARDAHRDGAAHRGVALELRADAAAPSVAMADAGRVTQVLHNLIANAIRHTPPGGRVEVALEPGEPGMARVSVTDTGAGIAADDLPRVFDRFWRADRSRSREQGGSGLGLAIARQLIEAQGGRIGVDSRPGQGSRFWFTLPLASGGAA